MEFCKVRLDLVLALSLRSVLLQHLLKEDSNQQRKQHSGWKTIFYKK